MQKGLYIKTYGCQSNVYDSEKMVALLKPYGYYVTEDLDEAELVIFNTCHIREKAEQKFFSDLGRVYPFKKKADSSGKQFIIAVGGCTAQVQKDLILKKAPYVSIVFGPQAYHRLPEYLRDHETAPIVNVNFPAESKFDFLPQQEVHSASAFLAIQEGCNKFCTFCCVPYTRGREFSRPIDQIIDEARKLVDDGVIEITLLGQNVNAFHGLRPDGTEGTLAELIEKVSHIKGLERIRYVSSHPREMTDDLIAAHGSIEKLMPQLHLALQSGSDQMLKRMNRKHKIEFFYNIVEKLRNVRPDILISTDIIAGFPGETEEDHQQTLQAIHDVIDMGFSFAYSPRQGTPASVMEEQVPEEIKKRRLYEIQDLLRMKQHSRYMTEIGKTLPVFVEEKAKKEGQLLGKSPYLQSVCFYGDESLIGKIVPIRIENAYQNCLEGTRHEKI